MEILLWPVLVVWVALPFAVAVVPPVVALSYRRVTAAGTLLYVAALGLVAANWYAQWSNMDWADRTGGEGSVFAGGTWLIAGVLAAAAAVVTTVRTRPRGLAAA